MIIVTEKELKLINEYIKEQHFWRADTKDNVRDLFIVLVGYGLEPQKAINNIDTIIEAMKNEYGE